MSHNPQPDHEGERRIVLVRHAHSAWPSPGKRDFDRELDAAGRAEATAMARGAVEAHVQPTSIICSPAERCLQTAAIYMDVAGASVTITYDPCLYSETVSHYKALADDIGPGETLMVIGHNSMIEETFICLGGARLAKNRLPGGFPTAGLAAFVRKGDGPWRLEALLP